MSRPTSSILESSDIIMVDDDDHNDAIIILTEDVAKEQVLAVDVIIRSAVSKSIPNDKEPRKWSELSWNDRLSLITNFTDTTAIEVLNIKLQNITTKKVTSALPRASSEITSEGLCLSYSSEYQCIVAGSIPNESEPRSWKDLTWSERLTLLRCSNAEAINAMIKRDKDERDRIEIAERPIKLEAEASAALCSLHSGKDIELQKFPLLGKYCVFRNDSHVEVKEHEREEITRVVLHHSLFGDDQCIEVLSYSYHQMFTWGVSGGYTKCRLITKDEAANGLPMMHSYSTFS